MSTLRLDQKAPSTDHIGDPYRWKASVSVFTVTHALTNRSNVIPGEAPYPEAEAFNDEGE